MIKLYTLPTCPKCKILKAKLDEQHIEYEECQDREEMMGERIEEVPMLVISTRIDEKTRTEFLLPFSEAVKWIQRGIENKENLCK